MDVKSNNDSPFDIAVSSFCWSTQSDTPFARQFSEILISSTSDFPILHTDKINTCSIDCDWIALINASSPGRRSLPFFTAVGRSVNTCTTVQLRLAATVVRCVICSSADAGQSGLDRA